VEQLAGPPMTLLERFDQIELRDEPLFQDIPTV
jgi:hypothetical protein